MFTFCKLNLVELEGNLLFVEHGGGTAGAGGLGTTKELENHGARFEILELSKISKKN